MEENTHPTMFKIPHQGENVKRFRGLRGIKQVELANLIGVSEQTMVAIEKKPEIDEKTLSKLAKALGVTVDDIKYYNENCNIRIFHNNGATSFFENDNNITNNYNPLDEVKALYERIIQMKDDEINRLMAGK